MASISPSTPWPPINGFHRQSTVNLKPTNFIIPSRTNKPKQFPSLIFNSASKTATLAGGEGAGGMLSYTTYFVSPVSEEADKKLIMEALEGGGLHIDRIEKPFKVPNEHAVVMLQSVGKNSIIIAGGANTSGWPDNLATSDLEIVKNAGIVLLQRDIPDSINIQVAKAATSAGVRVVLDCGGMDTPIPVQLLKHVDILNPNESELACLTEMQTESFEQIGLAVAKCHELGVKEVLVNPHARKSVLFVQGKVPIANSFKRAETCISYAEDTFTHDFACFFVNGKPISRCLTYAFLRIHLCVQVKGAIPGRKAVLDLLQSV